MNIVSVYPCLSSGCFDLEAYGPDTTKPPFTRSEKDAGVTHRAFIPLAHTQNNPLQDIRFMMKNYEAVNEQELLYGLTDEELAMFILTFS